MRKLLSLILFVVCSTFLFGCATIEYQRIVNPDGSIVDTVVFEIDSSVNQVTANMLLDDIYQDVYHYYVVPVKTARDAYSTTHMDSTIKAGISVNLEPANREYRTIKVSTICANTDMFSILNKHILPEVYVENSSLLEENESSTGYSVSAFIIKYIQKTTNAFGNIEDFELQLQDGSSAVNFAEEYSKKYAGGEYHMDNSGTFSAEDIKLRQLYISTDTRLNSNANHTLVDGGFKYHLWELDSSDPDFELVFYYKTANSVGWYYLALGITFVVMFALIIVYSKRMHKENKVNSDQNVTIINKDDEE